MLSGLMDALQGPAAAATDSGDDEGRGEGGAVAGRASRGAPAAAAAGPALSLWGMASALAENVKKGAADIAETCAPRRAAAARIVVCAWEALTRQRTEQQNSSISDTAACCLVSHLRLLARNGQRQL